MNVSNRMLPLCLLVLVLSMPAICLAEDEKKQTPETPLTEWLAEETKVIEALSDAEKEQYFILRNKHGIIRSIRFAKGEIGRSVQKCGQDNPDIQDKVTQRFDAWTDSVDPILKTADAYLKEEIKAQTMIPHRTFIKMQNLNDKAFEFQQDQLEVKILSDRDSCEALIKSMDATEENMLRLMQEILLPVSVIQDQSRQ